MAKRATPQPKTPPAVVRLLKQLSDLINSGGSSQATYRLSQLGQQYPKDWRIWDLLCAALTSLGKHAEAVDAGAKAAKLNPDSAEVHKRYSRALQKNGQYELAMTEIERAIYLSPDDPDLLHNKTMIYLDTAQHNEALASIRSIEQILKDKGINPRDYGGVFIDKARLAPAHIDAQEVIDDLDPIAHDDSKPKRFREIAFHQLGRLYELAGDYDSAFDRYTKGNEINKPKWNPDVFSSYVDELIACWEGIKSVPLSRVPDGDRLIFIAGMMRSGTSLTEQMIAQLPNVTPGGEMNAVARGVSDIEPRPNPQGSGRPLPVSRFTYTQSVVDKLARSAWKFYNDVSKDGYVTDKQPYNIWYVPLIARMFPGCKIVHTMRDPMDNCLSNFVQCYARSHPQTHTLSDMGRYHKDYQRMTEVWSSLEEVGMYNLQYEELVADPESQTKSLCEYLEIPWHEGVLSFHESDRTVRTASRDQVRKPLYKSSVKKYERYGSHLNPLRAALGVEPGESSVANDDNT